MNQVRTIQWFGMMAGLLLAMTAGSVSGADGVATLPITIVNYSKLPVYATAITLDEAQIDSRLGLAAGSPLRVATAHGGTAIPLSRAIQDGRPVLQLYVSLAAAARLDLTAASADTWPAFDRNVATGELTKAPDSKLAAFSDGVHVVDGQIANGVLSVRIDKSGWNLGFAPTAQAPAKLLIQNGKLDFWVDNQNRGRIANSDPADLGLIHSTTASFEKCAASVSPDGGPSIQIVRRMGGLAQAMSVTQTFELVPGMPFLVTRVHWQNDGAVPLWIAYVGSGNGVAGSWSRDLMTGPLVERKKSAILGDLNGGETRPSWIGQLCRISMESLTSGCGVGLSTLLPTPGKVGQGSMIWGCGGSGFQCNFIDPVQGQFPFLVPAHGSLDNGFVFLASQAGENVFRRTVEMWGQTSAGKALYAAPPCAVFMGGAAVYPQTLAETGDPAALLPLLRIPGAMPQAALRLDFNKYFQCRVSVRAANQQDVLEITAQPLGSTKAATALLHAEKSGDYVIGLNETLKWHDEVPFVLQVKTSGAAELGSLAIGEVLPVCPEPLSPPPDAAITDVATMFRWKAIPMVVDYDLQWSAAADFAAPAAVHLSDSHDYLWYLPPVKNLPAPGKWYWRVRGIKGGVVGGWSTPRAFSVNNDHATRPLRRPLTPQNPLFTLEASKVTDFTNFRSDVPEDLRPYVGIIAEGYVDKGLTIEKFAQGMDKLPHAILVRSHPPTWVGLADLEWLCQHVPNFIGIQGGETLSLLFAEDRGQNNGDADYYRRMLQVLAKYGLMYQEADGTYKDDKWQELMDKQGPFIRQYGPWLVLTQKNNIIRRQFYSQSCALGLWLGGITAGHGAWEDGGFYWQNAGFGELGECFGERRGILKDMPRIFWTLNFIMGVGRGCGIYSLDGQTLMFSPKEAQRFPTAMPRAQIWDTTGQTTETFNRFVVPLIRGVVRHGLIPSKEQVLQNVKLAVYNDKQIPGDVKSWPYYMEYGPLYAGTYGFGKMGNIDGQLWEFFPNTGRYYYIPVLPQGKEPLGAGVQILPVSQLQSVAEVKRAFDAAYPSWYEGTALVTIVGDTITILNSNENQDVTESWSLPMHRGGITRMAGKIGPHAYVVGKFQADGQLWLQSNAEYPDRQTEIVLTCEHKPEWSVAPAAGTKTAQWDEASKSLHLCIAHPCGAVEVNVKSP